MDGLIKMVRFKDISPYVIYIIKIMPQITQIQFNRCAINDIVLYFIIISDVLCDLFKHQVLSI